MHFSNDEKLYGRVNGLKPKLSVAQQTQRLVCSQFSTCLMAGFIRSLLKVVPSSTSCLSSRTDSPIHKAAVVHLAKIRAIVRELAHEANLRDPAKFAQVWHMLMKGSIISAGEGNRQAAREAKYAARLVLDGWKHRKMSRHLVKRHRFIKR